MSIRGRIRARKWRFEITLVKQIVMRSDKMRRAGMLVPKAAAESGTR